MHFLMNTLLAQAGMKTEDSKGEESLESLDEKAVKVFEQTGIVMDDVIQMVGQFQNYLSRRTNVIQMVGQFQNYLSRRTEVGDIQWVPDGGSVSELLE